MTKRTCLLSHRVRPAAVAVAEAIDADTARKVSIAVALFVVTVAPLASLDEQVEAVVRIHHVLSVCILYIHSLI